MQKKIHHGSTIKVQNLGEEIKWMKSGQWLSLGAGEWEKPWGGGKTWAVVLEVSSLFLLFFLSFFSARDSVSFIFYGENTQYKIYSLNPFLSVQYIIHYMYDISTGDL